MVKITGSSVKRLYVFKALRTALKLSFVLLCTPLIMSINSWENQYPREFSSFVSTSNKNTTPRAPVQTLRVAFLEHPNVFHAWDRLGFEKDIIHIMAYDLNWKIDWVYTQNKKEILKWLADGYVDLVAMNWNEETDSSSLLPQTNSTEGTQSLVLSSVFLSEPQVQICRPKSLGCETVSESQARFKTLKNPVFRKSEKKMGFTYHRWPMNARYEYAVNDWIRYAQSHGRLESVKALYKNHFRHFKSLDAVRFYERFGRLKEYQPLFKRYAKDNRIPWPLVAAVGYQESQWQNDVVSFTGVKGLMMLTQDTADFLGVQDRENPEESIRGGATYLKFLIDRQPSYLLERERWALALAAYNTGLANLRDVQKRTQAEGRNPLKWVHVQKTFENTNDTMRGLETSEFVDRVLGYYDLIILK